MSNTSKELKATVDKELKDIGKAAREENTSIDKGGAHYYFFKPNKSWAGNNNY